MSKDWNDSYFQTIDSEEEGRSFVLWYMKEYYEEIPDEELLGILGKLVFENQTGDTNDLDGLIDNYLVDHRFLN